MKYFLSLVLLLSIGFVGIKAQTNDYIHFDSILRTINPAAKIYEGAKIFTTYKSDTARILMLIADTSSGVSHNVFYLRGYEIYTPFQIGRYFIADGENRFKPLPVGFVIVQIVVLNYKK